MGKDLFNVPEGFQESGLLVIWAERKAARLEHEEWEGSRKSWRDGPEQIM